MDRLAEVSHAVNVSEPLPCDASLGMSARRQLNRLLLMWTVSRSKPTSTVWQEFDPPEEASNLESGAPRLHFTAW